MQPARARRLGRLDGAGIDALDGLGVELGQRGHGVEPQRQRAGERAKADPHGEDDGPQQRLDGAHNVEDGPDDGVDGQREAVGPHQIARGQKADRYGEDDAQHGREKGQGQRLADLLHDQRQRLRRLQTPGGHGLNGADGMGQRLAGAGVRCQWHGLGHAQGGLEAAVGVGHKRDQLAVEHRPARAAQRVNPLHLPGDVRPEPLATDRQQVAHRRAGCGGGHDRGGRRRPVRLRQRIDARHHDRRQADRLLGRIFEQIGVKEGAQVGLKAGQAGDETRRAHFGNDRRRAIEDEANQQQRRAPAGLFALRQLVGVAGDPAQEQQQRGQQGVRSRPQDEGQQQEEGQEKPNAARPVARNKLAAAGHDKREQGGRPGAARSRAFRRHGATRPRPFPPLRHTPL